MQNFNDIAIARYSERDTALLKLQNNNEAKFLCNTP